MPNVRASSGMIGTTRAPMSSSRNRLRSSRVNTIVVDTACFPEPALNSVKMSGAGWGMGLARVTRRGSEPSSARRRCIMYSYSGESVPGWK